MADRKPSWRIWIVANLVLMPAIYVLSFGPACWVVSRTIVGMGTFRLVYRPIDLVAYDGHYRITQFFEWYGELLIADQCILFVGRDDFGGDPFMCPEIVDPLGYPIDESPVLGTHVKPTAP